MEENKSGRCLTIGERARRMAQGDLRGSRVATCVKCAYTLSAPAVDSTCPMYSECQSSGISGCPDGVRVRYTCSSLQVRKYAQRRTPVSVPSDAAEPVSTPDEMASRLEDIAD